MFAGHETTAKTVRIYPQCALFERDSHESPLVDLWSLGLGQAPELPGETPHGDLRDSDEGQGERRC